MSEPFDIQQVASSSVSSTRRKTPISLLVIHDDPRTAEEARAAFTAKRAKVAPHYYIDSAGQITQFVPDTRAARHSGSATWNGRRRNIDRMSIGITLERGAGADYTDKQLTALHWLLDRLMDTHRLTAAAIVQWEQAAGQKTGSLRHVLPPPAPAVSKAPLPAGPMVLGAEDSASQYGFWAFLQTLTYRQRGKDFKYTVGDLAHSQAFPIYATKLDLGAPLAPNLPTPLIFNGNAYNYQAFARDTIFNEGTKFSAVQSLNSLFENAIPAGGLARALLEASYKAALGASRTPLKGNQALHPEWRFHYVALRERLGPPLSGNYVTDDGQWAMQVFAGDTLYTPMSDQSGCELLSHAEPSAPEYTLMWTETYKVCGAPYNPNSPFQQLAVQLDIGTPLSGVFQADYGGASYQVQVFAHDTLYAGPDGNVQRMSALPKPPDILAWQPAPATPPPAPAPQTVAAAAVNVGGAPQRSANWPPKPDFRPLPSNEARQRVFGAFQYVRTSGDNIRITDNWDQANIIMVSIPQLARLAGTNNGNIRFHKLAADQLRRMWAAWEAAGLLRLVLSWSGSFVPRFMRSGKQLSTHAFGCAFDINVPQNGYYKVPALVGDVGSVRELVPIANQHGFYWGGHFDYGGGLSDGMHFEWAVAR